MRTGKVTTLDLSFVYNNKFGDINIFSVFYLGHNFYWI